MQEASIPHVLSISLMHLFLSASSLFFVKKQEATSAFNISGLLSNIDKSECCLSTGGRQLLPCFHVQPFSVPLLTATGYLSKNVQALPFSLCMLFGSRLPFVSQDTSSVLSLLCLFHSDPYSCFSSAGSACTILIFFAPVAEGAWGIYPHPK